MFRKAVRTRVLKKKDVSLGALLHETIQKQREEIRSAMMNFTYFKTWPEDKIHQCCVHSNIISYNENDIIRVKDDANVDVTHFILNGKVTVIQRLIVVKCGKKRDKRKYPYKLYKDQSIDVNTNPNLESIHVQICHLLGGATFGLGEELCKHTIIAQKDSKCLLIPRHIILGHYSMDNVWQKIILYLNTVYPTSEEVFQQFQAGRQWREYCNSLKKEMILKARPTSTIIHDVPLNCRSKEPRLSEHYMKAKSEPLYLLGERDRSDPFVNEVTN